MQTATRLQGYDYGCVPLAPITPDDLELLKATVLFTPTDEQNLRKAGEILSDQVGPILDCWYDYMDNHPHLMRYFSKKRLANLEYLTAVRRRFGQWIKDLCFRTYDQDWLNYQYEIGLRHHSIKKNQTDEVEAAPIVHCRYMIGFVYPITATIRPFLENKGHKPDEVEAMYQAWFKAVVLTVTLWTHPYVAKGEW